MVFGPSVSAEVLEHFLRGVLVDGEADISEKDSGKFPGTEKTTELKVGTMEGSNFIQEL